MPLSGCYKRAMTGYHIMFCKVRGAFVLAKKDRTTARKESKAIQDTAKGQCVFFGSDILLAPTGALIVMLCYYVSAAATFSDFHSVH